MFFELLLSNEPIYIFLGSDSIHSSNDSFFLAKRLGLARVSKFDTCPTTTALFCPAVPRPPESSPSKGFSLFPWSSHSFLNRCSRKGRAHTTGENGKRGETKQRSENQVAFNSVLAPC
jgi:hypothetical protein